jgi:hypothetical protein
MKPVYHLIPMATSQSIDDILSPLPASTCDTPVLLIRTAAGAHPWFAADIEN